MLAASCTLISKGSALVSRAEITRYYKRGGLKLQKFTLPEFWSLNVENHGLGRSVLSLKSPGEDPSSTLLASLVVPGTLTHSLACRRLTPIFASIITQHPLRLLSS